MSTVWNTDLDLCAENTRRYHELERFIFVYLCNVLHIDEVDMRKLIPRRLEAMGSDQKIIPRDRLELLVSKAREAHHARKATMYEHNHVDDGHRRAKGYIGAILYQLVRLLDD